jgi:hypothetical protein
MCPSADFLDLLIFSFPAVFGILLQYLATHVLRIERPLYRNIPASIHYVLVNIFRLAKPINLPRRVCMVQLQEEVAFLQFILLRCDKLPDLPSIGQNSLLESTGGRETRTVRS